MRSCPTPVGPEVADESSMLTSSIRSSCMERHLEMRDGDAGKVSQCTVDEQLLNFRGRCLFRVYMKDKPDKYGLKIISLNDSKTAYMIDAVPYLAEDMFEFLQAAHEEPQACPIVLYTLIIHTQNKHDMASSLMSVITGACDASMSEANPRRRREPVYWWTPEIDDLRRFCLRARRLFQRSRGRHDEETHSANYASARRLLRVAIKTSKRRCWRQLCDEVNNDVWGKPYRIAMSRLGCPQAKQPSSPLPLLVRGAVAALFPRVPSGPAPATAASSGGAYTGRNLRETQRSSVEDKETVRARPGWHTQLSAQDRCCRASRHLLAGVHDVPGD
ncbi:unnamed protein product, partial [Trichogramma brassicae]